MNNELAYFSPSLLVFIPSAWKDDGTYTPETWPSDAVILTVEQTSTYWKTSPPLGQILGVVDGLPAWVDSPPITHEELVTEAIAKQKQLKAIADSEIDWRQDAVDGNYAEADEVTELSAWKKYRVLLMRTDTLKAPDIKWPVSPE
ncbi:TPA: tail fiber assembly protein [Yersinia enterocolitica]